MEKRIIYKNDKGGVSVIVPSPNANMSVEQIATKDVPTGKSYKIVDASEIPTDRVARDSWTVDEADMTDGVGA